MARAVAVLAAVLAATTAWGAPGTIVMEQGFAAGPVAGWQLGARATPEEIIHPIFMLRHEPNALKELETTLMEVSTPGNPRYGQHLSREEVARRFPPMEGAKEAVLAWLEEHGAQWSQVSESSDMVQADVSVQVAETMLATTFHHFQDSTTGADVIRATAPYFVPDALAGKLYVVGDLVQLPGLRRGRAAEVPATDANQLEGEWPSSCGTGCENAITPTILAAAYKLPASTPASADAAAMTMAVSEFSPLSYDKAGLNIFQTACNLNYDVKVDRQVGFNNASICKIPIEGFFACGEALLHIEYIKAVAPSIPLTCVTSARYSLLEWALKLEGLKDLPQVQSVSYGSDEIDQTSPAFMDAANAQFMKFGTMGISILFASGERGVYGDTGPTADGRFHPSFPASSPYITTVGGTDFLQKSVVGPEKAWYDGGGGFSDHFAMPDYQKQAVAGYMTAAAGKLPDAKNFNATGRGYPDVAALGGEQNPYCIAAGFMPGMIGVSGTSAACPVVAGIIARVNAARAAKGKAAMGFLNPFLYQNADAFNDVTAGKNNGKGTEGFEAVKGWDPATGLGTPNYPLLEAAAMKASAGVEEVVV